jgi:hypothetical protein
MIGGLWEVPTKSEKVGPNDPQKPKKWVTKIVSGQSALITAIGDGPGTAEAGPSTVMVTWTKA